MARMALRTSRPPVAYWWRHRPNFGDELTPFLIHALTGKTPVHIRDAPADFSGPVYAAVGSILQHVNYHNLIIWGSGFIRDGATFPRAPLEIRAVRGPLTRDLVLRQGLGCPPIYGDPALLLPRFIQRLPASGNILGIVPHYEDAEHPAIARLAASEDVRLISVDAGARAVVEAITSCDHVASSSLHGIIVAIAYGIPAVWVDFRGGVGGGPFKYRDFFQSINAPFDPAYSVSGSTTPAELRDRTRRYSVDLDVDALAAVCPFG